MAEQKIDVSKIEKFFPHCSEKLGRLILEGVEERKCANANPGSCGYTLDLFEDRKLSESEIEQYINLICRKYPDACKLNYGVKHE